VEALPVGMVQKTKKPSTPTTYTYRVKMKNNDKHLGIAEGIKVLILRQGNYIWNCCYTGHSSQSIRYGMLRAYQDIGSQPDIY